MGEGSYSSVVAVIVEAVDKTLIPNCLGSVCAPHDTLIPTKREGTGGKGGQERVTIGLRSVKGPHSVCAAESTMLASLCITTPAGAGAGAMDLVKVC